MDARISPKKQQADAEFPLQVLRHEADYFLSMKLLEEHGLQPLTYQEAFVHIMQDLGLKERLKGNWFYVVGEGLELSGLYKIDKTGNLKPGKGDPEQTVCALPGPCKLSLFVDSDINTSLYKGRFVLYASDGPQDVAPVVVGMPYPKTMANSVVAEGRAALHRLQRKLDQ